MVKVALIGTGSTPASFGWCVYRPLLEKVKDLEKLILFTRKDYNEHAVTLFSNIKDNDNENLRKVSEGGYNSHGSGAHKIDGVKDADIAIICADNKTEYRNPDIERTREFLREITQKNASMIHDISENMKGYKGKVIMVTNPSDVMTDIFRSISGIEKTYGFNHTDSYRLRLIASQKASKILGGDFNPYNTSGFVIGPHSRDMVPLFSTVKFFGGRTFIGTTELKSLRGEVQNIVIMRGEDLIQKNQSASLELGPPLAEVINSIIENDGGHPVELSIPFRISDEKNMKFFDSINIDRRVGKDDMTYVGMPVVFEEGEAKIYSGFSLAKDEQERFLDSCIRTSKLNKELVQIGIEKIRQDGHKHISYNPSTSTIISPSIHVIAAGNDAILDICNEKATEYKSGNKIRSVSKVDYDGKRCLAFGLFQLGRDAVELRSPEDLDRIVETFKLNDKGTERIGFNSVVSIDDDLYAAHSKKGIFKWNTRGPYDGELIFAKEKVRHLQSIMIDGVPNLAFSADGIYLMPHDGNDKPKLISLPTNVGDMRLHDGLLYIASGKNIFTTDGIKKLNSIACLDGATMDVHNLQASKIGGNDSLIMGTDYMLYIKDLKKNSTEMMDMLGEITSIVASPGKISVSCCNRGNNYVTQMETTTWTSNKYRTGKGILDMLVIGDENVD